MTGIEFSSIDAVELEFGSMGQLANALRQSVENVRTVETRTVPDQSSVLAVNDQGTVGIDGKSSKVRNRVDDGLRKFSMSGRELLPKLTQADGDGDDSCVLVAFVV